MAKSNVVKLRALADADERCAVAQEAVWQIACLFDEFANFAMRLDHADTLQECTIVRALAARGRELSGVAMRMLGESAAVDWESRGAIVAGATRELDEESTLAHRLLPEYGRGGG